MTEAAMWAACALGSIGIVWFIHWISSMVLLVDKCSEDTELAG